MSNDKIVNINTLAADVLNDMSTAQYHGKKIGINRSEDFQNGFVCGLKALQDIFLREFPGVNKIEGEVYEPK